MSHTSLDRWNAMIPILPTFRPSPSNPSHPIQVVTIHLIPFVSITSQTKANQTLTIRGYNLIHTLKPSIKVLSRLTSTTMAGQVLKGWNERFQGCIINTLCFMTKNFPEIVKHLYLGEDSTEHYLVIDIVTFHAPLTSVIVDM